MHKNRERIAFYEPVRKDFTFSWWFNAWRIELVFISLRLHDPAGLHRATAAPVPPVSSAEPPAEARVPSSAGPGQRCSRSPAQSDLWQHPQLPLRPRSPQLSHQHQCSPSCPLPGEHPAGVRRRGAPGQGWDELRLGVGCSSRLEVDQKQHEWSTEQ